MIARIVLALLLFVLPARAEIAPQAVVSPGGVTAWLVESHDIPFVALELRFMGGASLDPAGKAGAVHLMAALLEEGTGDLDARAFAAARERLAADLRFSANADAVSVSARMLTENRDDAVALLRRALTEPAFPEDAIERVRAQVTSGLRSDATDPSVIATRIFDGIAFDDHPYARGVEGDLGTVAALTRDDIVAAHRAALARDRVFVSAVGDITSAELGALVDTLLAGLPETGAPLPPRVEPALTGGITVEPFDSPQSVIHFGHAGIGREDPDFFAAFVVNEIMGGGRFSARLMQEVRDRRGLTYGIGSFLAAAQLTETVEGRLQTANATVAEAIEVIRAEWRRIAEEGVTEAELEAAKTYLTGNYPLRFDGNGPIARALVGLQMQGYPIDYPLTRNDRVRAVTLADAQRAAARLYRPEALRFVVVGRPEGLEGQ
jgi:zinc protease